MTLDTWGLLMKHDMYISTQTLYFSGGRGELVVVAHCNAFYENPKLISLDLGMEWQGTELFKKFLVPLLTILYFDFQ